MLCRYLFDQQYHIAINFCLEKFSHFSPRRAMGENFLANYFTQWKICHAEIFARTGFYTWLPSSTSSASWSSISCLPGIQNLFLNLQPSLVLLLLYFCLILRDPYRRSYRLPLSQRPTLLWTVCSKLWPRKLKSKGSIVPRIVHTVHMCEYGTTGSTFDIRAYAWHGMACSFESSTHYFLVSTSRCGRN